MISRPTHCALMKSSHRRGVWLYSATYKGVRSALRNLQPFAIFDHYIIAGGAVNRRNTAEETRNIAKLRAAHPKWFTKARRPNEITLVAPEKYRPIHKNIPITSYHVDAHDPRPPSTEDEESEESQELVMEGSFWWIWRDGGTFYGASLKQCLRWPIKKQLNMASWMNSAYTWDYSIQPWQQAFK